MEIHKTCIAWWREYNIYTTGLVHAVERCLPLDHQGQVPYYGQWRGGGFLATTATLETPRSADEEHPRLPLHQLHLASAR
jgi:hypothetical protein